MEINVPLGSAAWLSPVAEATLTEYSRGQNTSFCPSLSSQLSLPRDIMKEVFDDTVNKQRRETKSAQDFRAESRVPVHVLASGLHVTNSPLDQIKTEPTSSKQTGPQHHN